MVTSDCKWWLPLLCGVVQPGAQEDHEEGGKLAPTADIKGRLILKCSNHSQQELLVQQESSEVAQHFRDVLVPLGNTPQGLEDDRGLLFLEEVEVDKAGQVSEGQVLVHLVSCRLFHLSVQLCKACMDITRAQTWREREWKREREWEKEEDKRGWAGGREGEGEEGMRT